MDIISIVLIEDNHLLREGIRALLNVQEDMNVIATISNGEHLQDVMAKHKPHLVLLDLGLKSQSSLNIVKSVRKNFPDSKIIVMDLIALENDVYEFIKAGVSGFLLKDASISDYYEAIRLVHQGIQVLPQNLTNSLFSQIVEYALQSTQPSIIVESVQMTKREKEIVQLISEGFSNKEIAEKINLSTYTVKSHVHNILEKLSLHTRIQVANYARITDSYKKSEDSPSLIDT